MKRKKTSETTSRKRKSPGAAKNPFLELQKAAFPASVNHQANDERVLSQVLAFSEVSRQKPKDGDDHNRELADTVTFLLEYLEYRHDETSMDTSSTQSLLSREDVATMLLEWAVKNLVHASNHSKSKSADSISLHWKTLKSCLCVLLSLDTSADLSSSLSQSTLNKLVPFAAQTALGTHKPSDAATCFTMLVQDLYRPTMDSACHSLLPLVDQHVSQAAASMDGSFLVFSTADHVVVLESTVQLLKRLQHTSNPKKIFQLLAEPSVLSVLSRWRLASCSDSFMNDNVITIDAAIRELLWEGLFSPLHHIEGFRGMNLAVPAVNLSSSDAQQKKTPKRPAFHCYQETLLQTIQLLIAESDNENENDTIIAAVLVVPDLLKGLIEMFVSWERDSAAAKSKKKGMAPVQFRLWCNLIYPIVEKLQQLLSSSRNKESRMQMSSDLTLVLVQSLRETLALVLQHNLYLPSHKDENNVFFSFLESLAVMFLEIRGVVGDFEEEMGNALRIESECLQSLVTLLRLNHLVVHERLPLLISACGRDVSYSDPEKQALIELQQTGLVLVIVQTYHRLRQLDHLFRSLLKATDTLRSTAGCDEASLTQEGHKLVALNRLLLGSKVRQEFAAAVLNCPSSQVKDLFKILNVWIQEHSNGFHLSAGTSEVSFAVSLFVLLIQNVRVDKHTSAEVARLCDDAIEKAVHPLIQESRAEGSCAEHLKREGLMLTGWLVDLKNRCAFWQDRTHEDNKESSLDIVPAILKESGLAEILASDDCMSEAVSGSLSHEIQFLLLHRIRELHIAIYEEQCAELTEQESRQGGTSLEGEARRLVRVVIAIAQSGSASPSLSPIGKSTSGWKLLAETITYWAPYSEPTHMEAFLSWMFLALSAHEHPEGGESEAKATGEERAIAETLLCDASFIEIPELATQFHAVGLRCVVDLVQRAVTKRSKASKNPIMLNGLDLTSTPESEQSSIEELGGAMSAVASTNFKSFLKGANILPGPLKQATWIIRLLNGSPLRPDDASYGRLMKLDILACALCLKSKSLPVETAILSLLCALRTCIAASMVNHVEVSNAHGLASFIRGFVASTTKVLKHISSLDEKTQLLRASERVIESLVVACLLVFQQRSEPLKSLVECFRALLTENRNSDYGDRRVLIIMSRALAKRLVEHFQRHSLPADEIIQDVFSPLIRLLQQSFGSSDELSLQNDSLQTEWLLLTGDTTRLTSLMQQDVVEAVDVDVVEKSLESKDESVRKAALYCLACIVASGHAPPSAAEIVVGECLSESNPLLDATFCRLVKEMDANAMNALLRRALSEAQSPTDSKRHALHLFQFMLEHAQGEATRKEVSQFARAFFAISLELMYPLQGADVSSWASECSLGISLLISLTENKDLITIRERDLGLILVQVASLLGERGTFRKPDVAPVDGRVYSSCFMLVSSLLQRFPKQLYACAPSVISTMHVLLRHALYGVLDDQESAMRAQKFTRLCELLVPHRDVYKKHVLVLILEYVGALRSSIHPSRSKSIVPAIYCLLDMLSQFETDQLNTMMDTTSKALFRSIYQSHHKTHMYKGQY
jgi:hypothetical protein